MPDRVDVLPHRRAVAGDFNEDATQTIADERVAVGQALGARDGLREEVRRRGRLVGPDKARGTVGGAGGERVVATAIHGRGEFVHG